MMSAGESLDPPFRRRSTRRLASAPVPSLGWLDEPSPINRASDMRGRVTTGQDQNIETAKSGLPKIHLSCEHGVFQHNMTDARPVAVIGFA